MQILYTKMNIFDMPLKIPNSAGPCEAVCVTTNGEIRKDGLAVMGRGIAKEANERFGLAKLLAERLSSHGNHAYPLQITQDGYLIITYPTKHNWRDNSDIDLIIQSAKEIVRICDQYSIQRCYLTPPGCANGRLNWEYQVRPSIEPLLDDRFIVVIRS